MDQDNGNQGSEATPTPTLTPLRRWGINGVSGLLVAFRLIFGIMWTSSGIFWMIRDDPAGYLSDAIERSLEQEAPAVSRPYRAFLDVVVRPHPLLFAMRESSSPGSPYSWAFPCGPAPPAPSSWP